MGRMFALALHLPAEPKVKNKKITATKMKVSFKFNFGLVIFAMLLVFGALYLWTVSDTSTKGYEIRSLEKQLGQAQEQGKRLELEAASLKSAQNLEQDAKALNLVPSSGVNYVSDDGYALKQ